MAVVRAYRNGLVMGIAGRNSEPPKRGVITGWSAGAVRRHTQALYGVEVSELTGVGFAFTLTMRDTPETAALFESLRLAWVKRIERSPGFIRLHWVVEWQERGTPHVHAAVYFEDDDGGDRQARALRAWLDVSLPYRSEWGAQHSNAIDGPVGWLAYLSKHAARGVAHYQRQGKPQGWEKTGRLYGFRGAWPRYEADRVELTRAGWFRLRRLVRSWRIADSRLALRSAQRAGSEKKTGAALRRISSARRCLSCGMRSKSEVRGLSEWVPEHVALLFLAILESEGHVIRESAEDARTRVLAELPSPEEADDARRTATEAAMAALGWLEVTDDAEVPF